MNILRTDLPCINKFLNRFKDLFSNRQFATLQMFVYAMLRDYKRLNLSSLSKQLPINYQNLQYFFSDAHWNYHQLNATRIKFLRSQRTTSFTKHGILAIDDTGSLKPHAKKTEGVSYQHCPSLKTEAYCNVAVASCFINNAKHIPLNFKFYKPQSEFPLGKYDENFKSKLQFANDLFFEALQLDIPFSYVLFDSWYASNDFLQTINDNNRKFITEINAYRRILFRHPLSHKMVWLQQNELVTLIKKFFWHKTRLVRYRDYLLPVYSFTSRLKNYPFPVKVFVVFNKWSDDDSKSIHIIISNDLKLSSKNVLHTYMLRWGIERTFQELKDTFYFDHYQVRSKEKIMRYWMLCALVFSLVYWIKLNGCLSKTLAYSPSSLNQYKQALFKLISFSSFAYLSKNADLSDLVFSDIKSQRFKNMIRFN